MNSRTVLEARLAFKHRALEEAQSAYLSLLKGGTKAYAIGSRNLTKLDLTQLENTISKLEHEISGLEETLHGGKPRKAVGVIPRDY